jgi:hypothetical protein
VTGSSKVNARPSVSISIGRRPSHFAHNRLIKLRNAFPGLSRILSSTTSRILSRPPRPKIRLTVVFRLLGEMAACSLIKAVTATGARGELLP